MLALRALLGAYLQQWKANAYARADLVGTLANVPVVATVTWIATRSGRSAVLGHVAVGLFFMTLWNQASLGMRWSLTGEAFAGTLEFNLLSPAPLMLVLLGKGLAHAASALLPGLVALATALAVSQRVPEVANVPGALLSVAAVFVAVIATAFIFCPLQVLAARELDPIVAIRPFVTVFSGFLYPVAYLPGFFQTAGRILPTSWGMDALLVSLEGGPAEILAADLAICLGLSACYFGFTAAMFDRVERRIRANAALVT